MVMVMICHQRDPGLFSVKPVICIVRKGIWPELLQCSEQVLPYTGLSQPSSTTQHND